MAEALSEIAYRHIAKKLMSGELAVGQKISEQKIAAECGISRTPVREAVRQLVEERLLYQLPRSGTYVTDVKRNEIIEAYEIRMAMECFMIDKAIRNMTLKDRHDLLHLAWAWRHHTMIEKAVRQGDAEKAREALRNHITRSMNDALKNFDASKCHAPELDDPVNVAVARLTGID